MNKRVKTQFNHVYITKLMSWLLKVVKPKALALEDFTPYLQTLTRVFETRGKVTGIAFSKAVRGNVMNYLSGSSQRVEGVRLTTLDRLPICLGPLLRVVRDQDPVLLRLVMTILFCTRYLRLEPNPDFSPLEAPLKKGTSFGEVGMFASRFWLQIGYRHQGRLPRVLRFKRFYLNQSSGPNGHALNTWARDLFSLPERLRESITILGGSRIETFMNTALGCKDILKGIFNVSEGGYRKLSYFPDREGKTRVIAIGDYFSQSVLRGLHVFLFRALKKIPQDCTFDQGGFKERLKNAEFYYSVDLKNATDRFPIQVISSVLKGLLPPSYVNAWEDIMVGYPFRAKLTKPHKIGQVKIWLKMFWYKVGNPMGFYSSWASFAVAHHYIIYYICSVLGKDWKTLPYALLGDDIVIGDKDVGEEYLKVMEKLGVEVSMSKTHKSSTTYEFAKRWVHKGSEISPFPFSAVKEMSKKSYLLALLLCEAERKDWTFTQDIGACVADFYGIVKTLPSSLRKKFGQHGTLCEHILKCMWGVIPAGEAMNAIARQYNISLPTINDTVGMNLLANCAVESFASSQPQVGKGKPLGLVAENILIYLTGIETEHMTTLLENPFLHAYGNIEQQYLDLTKLAREIDTVRGGDWPLILKSMTTPKSDEIFTKRENFTTALGSSKLGHAIVERLRMLESYPQLLNF